MKMQLGSTLEDNPIRQGRVGVGVTFFFDLPYLTQWYLEKIRPKRPTKFGGNDTGQEGPGSICTHSPRQRWV